MSLIIRRLEKTKAFTLNFGPVHPAALRVLRLISWVLLFVAIWAVFSGGTALASSNNGAEGSYAQFISTLKTIYQYGQDQNFPLHKFLEQAIYQLTELKKLHLELGKEVQLTFDVMLYLLNCMKAVDPADLAYLHKLLYNLGTVSESLPFTVQHDIGIYPKKPKADGVSLLTVSLILAVVGGSCYLFYKWYWPTVATTPVKPNSELLEVSTKINSDMVINNIPTSSVNTTINTATSNVPSSLTVNKIDLVVDKVGQTGDLVKVACTAQPEPDTLTLVWKCLVAFFGGE